MLANIVWTVGLLGLGFFLQKTLYYRQQRCLLLHGKRQVIAQLSCPASYKWQTGAFGKAYPHR